MSLPNGWKKVKLGDVLTAVDYGTAAKSDVMGKYPVLRMGNLENGYLVWDDLVYTSSEEEYAKYELKKGDILFNRTNSRDKVGKTSIYRGERPSIFAGYLIRLKVNSENDPYYVNYCMNSKKFAEFCKSVRTDAIGQSNINAQALQTYEFSLPPLEEQKKIAATLSVWDTAIEKMEKLIDAKENEFNIVLKQNLLEKGITLKWKEIPLTEILKSITPPSKIHQDSYLNSGKYPIVDQSKDLIAGWTNDESNVLETNRPLIIFGDHTCALKIMHVSFAQGADGIKILSAKDGYDPTYIFYAIKANPVIPEGYKRHFSALMLKNVLCPSLEEQKKYAAYFKSLDDELSLLKQQLENYKKQKQGLMQKLLTGQWRVK